MLVHPSRQVVVLTPDEAQHVDKCIPHAKTFAYRGAQLTAVPHGLEETRVLRNLGLKVHSPILNYYRWPRNTFFVEKPFKAQYDTAAFLSLNWRAHVNNGLGSGKTLSTAWAWDYLRSLGLSRRLLVVSTLSTMEPVWQQTFETHFPHLTTVILHGTKAKRAKLLERAADVYIINHDGVGVLLDPLCARDDISAVIIDEVADAARNARTDRFRALDSVCNGVRYVESSDGVLRRTPSRRPPKPIVWGLTATPTPNKPTDAYAQARLITPEKAPRSFTQFQKRTMNQISQFQWIPKPDAMEQVHDILSPAIRFSTDECVDLPPTTYLDRRVPLTKEQQKAYDTMRQHLVLEHAEGKIVAANEGVKLNKLIQIACGFGYDVNGKVIHFDAKPRLQEVDALIQQSQSKALVLVPFIETVGMVKDYLVEQGHTVEGVWGEVKTKERDRIFAAFQNSKDPHVLVCQPEVMAHGLTLTAASMSIWYAPYLKASVYEQANGRTPRPGQKLHTNIANIGSTAIEQRIYDRLKRKATMQGVLLDLIRDGRET